jgi:EAL domain-containing protein (putative c-di-GMP-specific phosphodiesterase class I)
MNKQKIRQLRKIIKEKRIHTLFQPIISLKDQKILGYEALSRGPKGMALENPSLLFETANANHMTLKLEDLCHRQAIKSAQKLPKGLKLFLNIEVPVLDSRLYRKMNYLRKSTLKSEDIVLEITERSAIKNIKRFKKRVAFFQKKGFHFALDDTGTGYNSIKVFWKLKPEYLKLPASLIQNIDRDPLKEKFIKVLVDCAKKTRAKTIAEAVERRAEFKLLRRLGVDYAQGYLFARPGKPFPKIKKIKL